MFSMKPLVRWFILLCLICGLVIAPFLIWGEPIEDWVASFIRQARDQRLTSALIIGLLLAGDILLPVPSSLLCTAAGMILGWVAGTAVCMAGLSLCSILGYAMGQVISRPRLRRWLGAGDEQRVLAAWKRLGDTVLVVMRPVPVLAEASVLLAGIGKMPLVRFLAIISLANLGISMVYAGIGAWAGVEPRAWSFPAAFFAALLLPALAMLIVRNRRLQPPSGG